MDAALLLLPTVGFVDFADERMIRTTMPSAQLWRKGPAAPLSDGNDGLEGRKRLPSVLLLVVRMLGAPGRIEEADEVLRRVLPPETISVCLPKSMTSKRRNAGQFPPMSDAPLADHCHCALGEMQKRTRQAPEK